MNLWLPSGGSPTSMNICIQGLCFKRRIIYNVRLDICVSVRVCMCVEEYVGVKKRRRRKGEKKKAWRKGENKNEAYLNFSKAIMKQVVVVD